ncbi:MAG TPA: helix-turn-helix domain-containing protein [Candidatus Polarisedimenticolaceae bacterium]|nr:helix-turn-helix domain-containing protein [Candidatus Polarisedimenticolaceae bacterium]
MTLREAAELTRRSITTLRRHIRSGRLHAEKRYGRFGPEYFVSEQDLTDAGLDTEVRALDRVSARGSSPATSQPTGSELASYAVGGGWLRDIVPLSLYQELQMKHEQLLVQYGMVRAGGLRAMEIRAELDRTQQQLDRAGQESARVQRALRDANSRLESDLREARLELEGRQLVIAALEEKTRALEMLTRNAVTNEALDVQLEELRQQRLRVDDLKQRGGPEASPASDGRPPADKTLDH